MRKSTENSNNVFDSEAVSESKMSSNVLDSEESLGGEEQTLY